MQAIERSIIAENWITILLVFLLILLVFLKSLDAQKLKGYVFAVFNKGFVEIESEEGTSLFTLFQSILFLFASLTTSLLVYLLLLNFNTEIVIGYRTFFTVFLAVSGYFFIRWFLEFLLSVLFLMRNETHAFLFSKFSYLYSISFGFFVLLILYNYAYNNSELLLISSLLFILIRFVFMMINNKNLIISKLFYFILYLCAFEIAPLFILFKLIF